MLFFNCYTHHVTGSEKVQWLGNKCRILFYQGGIHEHKIEITEVFIVEVKGPLEGYALIGAEFSYLIRMSKLYVSYAFRARRTAKKAGRIGIGR